MLIYCPTCYIWQSSTSPSTPMTSATSSMVSIPLKTPIPPLPLVSPLSPPNSVKTCLSLSTMRGKGADTVSPGLGGTC